VFVRSRVNLPLHSFVFPWSTGKITAALVRAGLEALSEEVTEEEVAEVVKACDSDKDGVVNTTDFATVALRGNV
jgi:Ca2+-binding EF-hand superfamily protein